MRFRELELHGLAASELVGGGVRVVVVHGVGPRVAWLGKPGGENLLFWDEAGEHRRGAWRLRGGHRLWLTRPLADESEETYAPDESPCRVRRLRDGLVASAPPDAQRLERQLAVRLVGPGELRVEHRLVNRGDMLWSGGLWALTCTRPRRRTRYRVPTDAPGADGWDVFKLVIPRRWGGGHTSRVDDPQIQLGEREIRFRAGGREAKRMLLAPRGTLTMHEPDEGLTFEKQAAFVPGARYPQGTNVAFYLAPRAFMVELETMGPEQTLAPGETLLHVERWTLRPLVAGERSR